MGNTVTKGTRPKGAVGLWVVTGGKTEKRAGRGEAHFRRIR